MTRHAEPAALPELIDALLECTGPITQILDHMVRAPGQPEVDAAVIVLRRLLSDVLSPLATLFSERDLRATTAALEAAAPMIVENLVLVPHAPRSRSARRRTRGHG